MVKKVSRSAPSGSTSRFRFAHPFFTSIPISERKRVPGVGKRMTDFIADTLLPIPAPKRKPPRMILDEIVGAQGAQDIEKIGVISFHAVGDAGHAGGGTEDMQEFVADAMTADFDINAPATSPAFFLHLGDVDYYDNTDRGYHEQFYVPYKRYPGKIIAIPGNHDGEIFKFDGALAENGRRSSWRSIIRHSAGAVTPRAR
jgi:Calcineurin-like phosphoesterase